MRDADATASRLRPCMPE